MTGVFSIPSYARTDVTSAFDSIEHGCEMVAAASSGALQWVKQKKNKASSPPSQKPQTFTPEQRAKIETILAFAFQLPPERIRLKVTNLETICLYEPPRLKDGFMKELEITDEAMDRCIIPMLTALRKMEWDDFYYECSALAKGQKGDALGSYKKNYGANFQNIEIAQKTVYRLFLCTVNYNRAIQSAVVTFFPKLERDRFCGSDSEPGMIYAINPCYPVHPQCVKIVLKLLEKGEMHFGQLAYAWPVRHCTKESGVKYRTERLVTANYYNNNGMGSVTTVNSYQSGPPVAIPTAAKYEKRWLAGFGPPLAPLSDLPIDPHLSDHFRTQLNPNRDDILRIITISQRLTPPGINRHVPKIPQDRIAQYELAQRYKEGGLGVPYDHDLAFHIMQLSALQGYPPAQRELGDYCCIGIGCSKSRSEERKWNLFAAYQGDVEAQKGLGARSLYGRIKNGRRVSTDYAEAVVWYRLVSDQGVHEVSSEASKLLMGIYSRGYEEFPQDNKKAFKWGKIALLQGHKECAAELELLRKAITSVGIPPSNQATSENPADKQAQREQGESCYYGFGPTVDDIQAVHFYRLAAAQLDANAQYELGFCLYHGHGVPPDPIEGARQWQLAADQGHADALCDLGFCHYVGRGVPQNIPDSLDLFRKAVARGSLEARAWVRIITARMEIPDISYLSLCSSGAAAASAAGAAAAAAASVLPIPDHVNLLSTPAPAAAAIAVTTGIPSAAAERITEYNSKKASIALIFHQDLARVDELAPNLELISFLFDGKVALSRDNMHNLLIRNFFLFADLTVCNLKGCDSNLPDLLRLFDAVLETNLRKIILPRPLDDEEKRKINEVNDRLKAAGKIELKVYIIEESNWINAVTGLSE